MKDTAAAPPRAKPSVDIKRLPLRPEEAFVFSRVDGRTLPRDIALMTGMSTEQVQQALERLDQLGAIEGFADAHTSHHSTSRQNAEAAFGGPHASNGTRTSAPLAQSVPPQEPSDFLFTPNLDIPESEQRRVWSLYTRLAHCDHYRALGLPRAATRKQVKTAYFERVAAFHPDKYFGKNLGPYKEKFEFVFQRLTTAHDTLSRSQRRRDYDAQLPPESLAADEACEPSQPPAAGRSPEPVGRDLGAPMGTSGAPESEEHGGAHEHGDAHEHGGAPASQPHRSKPAHSESQRSLPPVSVDERRQLAARALQRGLRSMPSGERPASPASPAGRRTPSAPPPSSRSIGLERARAAETRGDCEIAAALYDKWAQSEKDPQLFARAAQCFERAALVAAEPEALWKRAVDSARHAVQLAPNHAGLRLQLSRMYAHAGLRASALKEAERAQELSPTEKTVQSWLERVRRGDV